MILPRRHDGGGRSWGEMLAMDDPAGFAGLLGRMDEGERGIFERNWSVWGRPEQLAPPHDWTIWLVMAGRGFGKTRAGAEWVRHIAATDGNARIALVAANMHEARSVMVEGAAGILAISPESERPHYEPSLKRLVWPGGARATLYSAAEPDSLRGPEHSHGWCDEIAKWDISRIGLSTRAELAWDNLHMGLRIGRQPQVMATTTPKPVELVKRIVAEAESGGRDIIVTRGSTYANTANLSARYIERMQRNYGGSSLGRQEIDGELLADIEGALWNRGLIERCRVSSPLPFGGGGGESQDKAAPADSPHPNPSPKGEGLSDSEYTRILVAVDPPASATGDACGIIVAGLLPDARAHILADCSVEKPAPHIWARAVASAARYWEADRVVAEANQGGDMVRSVLQAASVTLPVKLVRASRGKTARAEPVAALYEAGRIFHAGEFGELEDQLCGMMTGGEYMGPGKSPDRADALVWAVHELLLSGGIEPRIRMG